MRVRPIDLLALATASSAGFGFDGLLERNDPDIAMPDLRLELAQCHRRRRSNQAQDLIITLKEITKDMQAGDANITAFQTLITNLS